MTSQGRRGTRTSFHGTGAPTHAGQCTKTGCHARASYYLFDWGDEVVTKVVATAIVSIVGNRTTTRIVSKTEEDTKAKGPTQYRTNGVYEVVR